MAEKFPEDNSECKSDVHDGHLCYFVSQGFHLSNREEYKQMVENPQFKCQTCGRAAKGQENLCNPAKL